MTVEIHIGDCLEVMARLGENSVDAICTDPPYHLTTAKRFAKTSLDDATSTSERSRERSDQYGRLAGGFMGQKWDGGDVAFRPETWAAALRVLKPGGHLLAFGGTRTYHRMVCAIEDAGFEIRDCIFYCYGTGFPKSHSVSKGIDNTLGAERTEIVSERKGVTKTFNVSATETIKPRDPVMASVTNEAKKWEGWGTALKPALEPIVLARKPLSEKTVAQNVLRWGTGAINIDASRIEGREKSQIQGEYKGSGVQVAGIPNSGKEYPKDLGRWPANLIHSGEDEVIELFPNSKSSASKKSIEEPNYKNKVYGRGMGGNDSAQNQHTDSGSAARFFYCAKASRSDRDDGLDEFPITNKSREGAALTHAENGSPHRRNTHATVKPTDLMRYLCGLITPKGGVVLDPFMGSGSTGRGALLGGFNFIGIEMDPEYAQIAQARIDAIAKRAP